MTGQVADYGEAVKSRGLELEAGSIQPSTPLMLATSRNHWLKDVGFQTGRLKAERLKRSVLDAPKTGEALKAATATLKESSGLSFLQVEEHRSGPLGGKEFFGTKGLTAARIYLVDHRKRQLTS